jgi:hypothetical protein
MLSVIAQLIATVENESLLGVQSAADAGAMAVGMVQVHLADVLGHIGRGKVTSRSAAAAIAMESLHSEPSSMDCLCGCVTETASS